MAMQLPHNNEARPERGNASGKDCSLPLDGVDPVFENEE
jgi:hypothetical protein